MHGEDVKNLADELLEADRVVTEQLVGLRWVAPTRALLNSSAVRGGIGLHSAGGLGGTASSRNCNSVHEDTNSSKNNNKIDRSELIHEGGRVRKEKVRRMLKMLRNQASFLVTSSSEDDTDRDNEILHALQVNTNEDMEHLLGYFYSASGDGNEEMYIFFSSFLFFFHSLTLSTHLHFIHTRYEEDETIEMGHLGLLVDNDDVVKTIREYMDEKNEMMETTTDALLTATKKASENGTKSGEKNNAAQNTRTRRDDAFWESAANVIPPRTIRVWNALKRGMEKYISTLKARSDLLGEVESLQTQNAELKGLLSQYLSADVNRDLQVPPARTIRLSVGGQRLGSRKNKKRSGGGASRGSKR